MAQQFEAGDFLVFQVESGYGLIRVLEVDNVNGSDPVWHVEIYRDLFPDIEFADLAAKEPAALTVEIPHLAITNRAFESTQVSKLSNRPVVEEELTPLRAWRSDSAREISDRSVRLALGLR